jgi:hypothetical protein
LFQQQKPQGCVEESLTTGQSTERSLQQSRQTPDAEGGVAEIRIEEKKRGAPWILILLLLIVAAIIGWWLWSNRGNGTEATGTPNSAVVDSTGTTRTP